MIDEFKTKCHGHRGDCVGDPGFTRCTWYCLQVALLVVITQAGMRSELLRGGQQQKQQQQMQRE